MMLYIALALILVGILCFIYVSFQTTSKKDLGGAGFSRGNSNFAKEKKVSAESLASRGKTSREVHSQMDQAFAEERKIRPVSQRQNQEMSSYYEEESESFEEDIVTRPLLREEERKNYMPPKMEEFQDEGPKEQEWSMEGILFLDLSGRLPYESLKQKVRAENLKGFRRMGQGRIREIPGGFSFQARNSEFSYRLDEVEKIVFYDEGFALLPLKRDYPTPVFITKEAEKFKSYLEYASRS